MMENGGEKKGVLEYGEWSNGKNSLQDFSGRLVLAIIPLFQYSIIPHPVWFFIVWLPAEPARKSP